MAALKLERNQSIATSVAAGEPLKAVADRHGLSIARVSKIAQATVPPRVVTLQDVRPTLIAMQSLLNSLLNQ